MIILILLQIFAPSLGDDMSLKYCPDTSSNFDEFNAVHTTNQIIRLEFMYETLCPFSKDVYKNWLNPAVQDLAPYLDIKTYPYGNAYIILNRTTVTIDCQHGDKECYGNMLHACAIEALKEPTKYVDFNACMIGLGSTDEAADTCGQKLNVDSASIKACAKSVQGIQLLINTGIESRKHKYTYVPYWLVNGIPRNLKDRRTIKEQLCARFENPPPECTK